MNPGNMMPSGIWIIPMAICVLVMLLMRFRGSFTAGGINNAGTRPDSWTKKDSPMEIIGKRYARGEISKSEYEQLKNDLAG